MTLSLPLSAIDSTCRCPHDWSDDPLVSGNHCEITNGFVLDNGSTNGTSLNNAPLKVGVKKMLKAGDRLQIGDRILRIETGAPRSADDDGQDLSRSKKFIGGIGDKKDGDKKDAAKDDSSSSSQKESDEDAKLTVEYEHTHILRLRMERRSGAAGCEQLDCSGNSPALSDSSAH